MKTLKINWSIDHDRFNNSYFLIGEYNGIKFVESVLDKYFAIPLMYKKWLIKRKFIILNS